LPDVSLPSYGALAPLPHISSHIWPNCLKYRNFGPGSNFQTKLHKSI
jgi:hypothetical protein